MSAGVDGSAGKPTKLCWGLRYSPPINIGN